MSQVASTGDRPFVQPKGLNNGLDRASIGKQRDDDDDQLAGLAQSFQHRAAPSTKGVSTRSTAIASALAIMIALKRRALAEGRKLTLASVPDPLKSLAIVYGVDKLIDS